MQHHGLTDWLLAQVEALRLQISQLKAENEFLAGRLSVNGYAAELLSFQLRALAIQGGLSNLMQRLATLSNYMSDFARAKEGEFSSYLWQ